MQLMRLRPSPTDNVHMCACMSAHRGPLLASLWVSWLTVKNCFFLPFRKTLFCLNLPALPAYRLRGSWDRCPSLSSCTATVHPRFVDICPSNSPACRSLQTSDCSVCATEPGRRLVFNPSISTAKSALVLGLRVHAHQDKIPFVQKLKEGIQIGQLLTFPVTECSKTWGEVGLRVCKAAFIVFILQVLTISLV